MGCSHSALYNTKDYKRLVEMNEWFKKEFPEDWRITEEDIKILSANMNVIPYFLDTFSATANVIILVRERGPNQQVMARYAVASSMAFVGEHEMIWERRLEKLRKNFAVIGEVINSM